MKNQVLAAPLGIVCVDPYNIISSFYCLGRGGFRTTLLGSGGSNTTSSGFMTFGNPNSPGVSFDSPQKSTAATLSDSIRYSAPMAVSMSDTSKSGTCFQTPQYLPTFARNLMECCSIGGGYEVPSIPSSPMIDRNWLAVRFSGTSFGYNVHRSVSDDHTLGGFISIPPMVVY